MQAIVLISFIGTDRVGAFSKDPAQAGRRGPMLDFNGKRIVITGAGGGVGRALCARFSELGATVQGGHRGLVSCHRDRRRQGEFVVLVGPGIGLRQVDLAAA
jgi:hypothetical protein